LLLQGAARDQGSAGALKAAVVAAAAAAVALEAAVHVRGEAGAPPVAVPAVAWLLLNMACELKPAAAPVLADPKNPP